MMTDTRIPGFFRGLSTEWRLRGAFWGVENVQYLDLSIGYSVTYTDKN